MLPNAALHKKYHFMLFQIGSYNASASKQNLFLFDITCQPTLISITFLGCMLLFSNHFVTLIFLEELQEICKT